MRYAGRFFQHRLVAFRSRTIGRSAHAPRERARSVNQGGPTAIRTFTTPRADQNCLSITRTLRPFTRLYDFCCLAQTRILGDIGRNLDQYTGAPPHQYTQSSSQINSSTFIAQYNPSQVVFLWQVQSKSPCPPYTTPHDVCFFLRLAAQAAELTPFLGANAQAGFGCAALKEDPPCRSR